jgi:hypothetical protein
MVANFGFGLAYVVLLVVVVLPAAGLYALTSSVVVAGGLGLIVFLAGVAVLKAMETIFAVALYNYATTGRGDGEFPEDTLRGAYVQRSQRGPFRPSGYWSSRVA